MLFVWSLYFILMELSRVGFDGYALLVFPLCYQSRILPHMGLWVPASFNVATNFTIIEVAGCDWFTIKAIVMGGSMGKWYCTVHNLPLQQVLNKADKICCVVPLWGVRGVLYFIKLWWLIFVHLNLSFSAFLFIPDWTVLLNNFILLSIIFLYRIGGSGMDLRSKARVRILLLLNK